MHAIHWMAAETPPRAFGARIGSRLPNTSTDIQNHCKGGTNRASPNGFCCGDQVAGVYKRSCRNSLCSVLHTVQRHLIAPHWRTAAEQICVVNLRLRTVGSPVTRMQVQAQRAIRELVDHPSRCIARSVPRNPVSGGSIAGGVDSPGRDRDDRSRFGRIERLAWHGRFGGAASGVLGRSRRDVRLHVIPAPRQSWEAATPGLRFAAIRPFHRIASLREWS